MLQRFKNKGPGTTRITFNDFLEKLGVRKQIGFKWFMEESNGWLLYIQ